MADPKHIRFDTLALHAGQQPDPEHGARAVPIYQTTSYVFKSTDQAASLFNLERAGHIYSRISNPTVAVLEERLCALEGGVGAIATASGQAALHLAIVTLMGSGGHIVASRALYGGSYNLLALTLPRFGITASFVDPRDPEAFKSAIRPETRLIFAETVGNPNLEVLDIPKIASVAHGAGLPLMIDATFTTPYLGRPIAMGADIVMHSATKYLGGHGVAIGGLLIDGGSFDWESVASKFPTLTEPYAGYHGLDFCEEFGPSAFIQRARAEGLRDFGACLSPTNAFHILQGVETLPVRMHRHIHNARQVVRYLERAPGVAWVNSPDLPEHPDHERAQELYPKGITAIVTFGIKGGRGAAAKFIERLKVFSHLANIGDAKSLAIHPASTTHQQMDAKALAKAGIGEELIRLSIGLEDETDLVDDLAQALHAATKGA
ncbi:MAG: O-acetylhomoserine aminocarboxypropyltransferase [Rhodospirillales bacterium]|jgi:O-acetylhomoserine (thiol)-lyase|nr:O-acetylhomoserine aminocarboxypropyltransferase [Rhodospirillales bacterium]